jgi:hypothetical protein
MLALHLQGVVVPGRHPLPDQGVPGAGDHARRPTEAAARRPVRAALRARHYSLRTEEVYIAWLAGCASKTSCCAGAATSHFG